MPADRELRRLLRFALALADEADAVAMRHFRSDLAVSAKPDRTLVTRADTEIETLLRERIADAHPAHGVLGEELGAGPGDAETRWILDPIDATHNFVRGIGIFATLIGLERAGELILGVVSAPALGERWHAVRGGGAFAGSRRLRVSAIDGLERAQVLYSSLRYLDAVGLGEATRGVIGRAWRDRGFGDFWGYMLVAQGSAEVMLEPELAAWDLAAPMVIVSEAGGRLTNLLGEPTIHGPGALATNGLLHDELLGVLAPVAERRRAGLRDRQPCG